MPYKQITGAFGSDDPAAVQFDAPLLCEAMRDKEFVDRIIQRGYRPWEGAIRLLAQL
jgi:hypothetical protein